MADSFTFTPVAVKVKRGEDPGFAEWLENLKRIAMVEKSGQFWIGDLLVMGEEKFREKADQVMNDLGLAYQTLADYRWVCKSVPHQVRQEAVSFAHHRHVAPLDAEEQMRWLEHAAKKQLSAEELRQEIKLKLERRRVKEEAKVEEQESRESAADPEPENARYRVVLADPPWQEVGYDALQKLRIPAEQDAVLFLVCPADRVRDGILLLEDWNFAFRTTAVLDHGVAQAKFWFRAQHEVVVVGTRGDMRAPPKERLMASVLKKASLHHVIGNLVPGRGRKVIKCDLFGEKPRDGWAALGRETKESAEA